MELQRCLDVALVMNGELSRNRPYYLAAWQPILMGWLGWSPKRYDRWVARWDVDLNDAGDGLFYHEDELFWILRLEVLLQELYPGGPHKVNWGTPEYDWNAAKQRVEEVLAKYGAALPPPNHVTSYERGILRDAAAGPE